MQEYGSHIIYWVLNFFHDYFENNWCYYFSWLSPTYHQTIAINFLTIHAWDSIFNTILAYKTDETKQIVDEFSVFEGYINIYNIPIWFDNIIQPSWVHVVW